MKSRPILFSGPMVRAILEGRKKQTRRIVTDQHLQRLGLERDGEYIYTTEGPQWNGQFEGTFWSPYGQVGDQLRISEEVSVQAVDHERFCLLFAADLTHVERFGDPELIAKIRGYKKGLLRGVHLPEAYSRSLRLEITGLRIERLNDISNADCVAEGIEPIGEERDIGKCCGKIVKTQVGQIDGKHSTVRQLYSELWESINGPGSWALNPWVWVVEWPPVAKGSSSMPSVK